MRMEYSRYIAYLRAANDVVNSPKVVIRSLREEKDHGDRIVTFGIEVAGIPVGEVDEALDLIKVIRRATRIAKMLNTLGIAYYYSAEEAIDGQEMEVTIACCKGIISEYITQLEKVTGE